MFKAQYNRGGYKTAPASTPPLIPLSHVIKTSPLALRFATSTKTIIDLSGTAQKTPFISLGEIP